MKEGVEIRKVDDQGRFVLPSDWRKNELEGEEVFVVKRRGYLKIIPKKRSDLTKFFDKVNLGINIGDWKEFERKFYEV
ncbi:MAG: AbrB/MazE/SpoVT family DNA-binding domain-containing protein [Candidatus Hydrothermarchaeota archaeon]